MDKLKKVIQAFENCTAPEMNDDDETCVDCIRAGECPWDDCQERDRKLIDIPLSLAMAALEALKAQETHVMTLEELEDALDTVVWVDRPLFDNTSNEYALIDAYSRKTQMVELRYPFSDKEYRERADYAAYGKRWRCWTSRPTDEQREAVPWET